MRAIQSAARRLLFKVSHTSSAAWAARSAGRLFGRRQNGTFYGGGALRNGAERITQRTNSPQCTGIIYKGEGCKGQCRFEELDDDLSRSRRAGPDDKCRFEFNGCRLNAEKVGFGGGAR